jgi:serine phosphatase RsbU (regulator of sigma subunit)
MYESLVARERVTRDLKLAEQVQKRFVPQSVPTVAGFEFFAHSDPAFEVRGDFYDFVQLPNNRLALALGEVSGKGVAAALMMAKFSSETRFCLRTESSPAAAAKELNNQLFASGIEEKFITLWLGVLDTEKQSLSITSAGHPPVLIRRANGIVDEIGEEVTGFPLGILPEAEYQQTEIKLNPGDVVVVYTDGVTDARNVREELYESREQRRLVKILANAPGSPELVGRAILKDIQEFSAGHSQVDDITLICFGAVSSDHAKIDRR